MIRYWDNTKNDTDIDKVRRGDVNIVKVLLNRHSQRIFNVKNAKDVLGLKKS